MFGWGLWLDLLGLGPGSTGKNASVLIGGIEFLYMGWFLEHVRQVLGGALAERTDRYVDYISL